MLNGNEYLVARYLHGAGVDERLVYWQYNDVNGEETANNYYLTNHQGSVVALASSTSGQQNALYTYDAYGNMQAGQESVMEIHRILVEKVRLYRLDRV